MAQGSKKAAVAALLICVGAGLTYAQMKRLTPGSAINNGHTGDDFGSPDERRAQFQQVARTAKITEEQQKKLEELRQSGDRREAWTKMQDILTTDQRQKMRDSFQARRAERDAKMRAAMGEEEFKKYQERRQQRWGGRGGPGGFGGPGGSGGQGGQGGNAR